MEIPFSKRKLRRNLVTCVAFVLLGLWLVIYRPEIDNPVLNSPVVIYGVGGMSILFFGLGLYFYLRKVADTKPAIIIDDRGITDNSSAFPLGFVPWQDIRRLATVTVARQRFLVIGLGNPQTYIEREKGLKKTTLEYNYRSYGSPFILSANGLACTLEELEAAIEQRRLKDPLA